MLSRLAVQATRAVARNATQLVRPASVLRPAVSARSFRFAAVRAAASSPASGSAALPDESPADADENMDEYDEDEYDDEDEYSMGGSNDNEVAMVTRPAPFWSCTALVDGKFEQLNSMHFLGHWTVLLFYPLDFTFVCPTELRAFNDRVDEFEKLGVKLVAASVDSEYSHFAWTQQPRESGGLGPMRIPMLADITKSIAKSYGVLLPEKGIALRGLFIIDPSGTLRQSTINDLPIGRSVDETLRLLQAFQFHEQHGEVCPSDWKPGQESMQADAAGLKKYFQKRK